jgi:hypothetical protein
LARTDNYIDQFTCNILGPEWEEEGRSCSVDPSSIDPWDGYAGVAPTGAHPLGASAEGIENLLGNVSEWVDTAEPGAAFAGCNFAMPGSLNNIPCERTVGRFQNPFQPELSTREKLLNRDQELAKLIKKNTESKDQAEEAEREEARFKQELVQKIEEIELARVAVRSSQSQVSGMIQDLRKEANHTNSLARTALSKARDEAELNGHKKGEPPPPAYAAAIAAKSAASKAYWAAERAVKENEQVIALKKVVKTKELLLEQAKLAGVAARSAHQTAKARNEEHPIALKAANEARSTFRLEWASSEEVFLAQTVGFRCAYDRKPKK